MRSGKNDAPESISSIMEKFAATLDYSKVEENSSLNKIWAKIVPECFKTKTQALNKTPDGTLFVACENSLVSNELVMMKREILKNINGEAEITNIVFSHKAWKNKN